MKTRKLIMVIDDESKIRRLLSENLEEENYDVVLAADGEQAFEVLHQSSEQPDIILLDLMMPGMDGMTFLKRLRKTSQIPVIILTAKDERPSMLEGFQVGADDFIGKPFYIDELLARIQAVLRRSKRAPMSRATPRETVHENGPIRMNPEQRTCLVSNEAIKLTDREFKLLDALVTHPGNVLTHERLLHIGWGEDVAADVSYLRVTFARIRKKLEQAGLSKNVISAYSNVGYLIVDLSD